MHNNIPYQNEKERKAAILAAKRKWYQKNSAKVKAYSRAYYAAKKQTGGRRRSTVVKKQTMRIQNHELVSKPRVAPKITPQRQQQQRQTVILQRHVQHTKPLRASITHKSNKKHHSKKRSKRHHSKKHHSKKQHSKKHSRHHSKKHH